jgi:CRP-like cAMP-binding protein
LAVAAFLGTVTIAVQGKSKSNRGPTSYPQGNCAAQTFGRKADEWRARRYARMNNPKSSLLAQLTKEDRTAFTPQLELVELAHKQHLLEPDAEIDFVYFPETCVCSVLALTKREPPIEVGMFGFEGMSDFVIRPGDRSYLRTKVLVSGAAWRIPAGPFAAALATLPSLYEVTLRYKDAAAIQCAYTSFANGSFTLEERLARWLLMVQDRSGSEALPIVHQFMASILAVRRSGVTTATHVLEGVGAIKATRGSIVVTNRAKLEEMAGESYGPAERACADLMNY